MTLDDLRFNITIMSDSLESIVSTLQLNNYASGMINILWSTVLIKVIVAIITAITYDFREYGFSATVRY